MSFKTETKRAADLSLDDRLVGDDGVLETIQYLGKTDRFVSVMTEDYQEGPFEEIEDGYYRATLEVSGGVYSFDADDEVEVEVYRGD